MTVSTISLGDGSWLFWDYVKAVAACVPALALITLLAVLPVLLGG